MLALRCRSITSAALKPAGQVATLAAAPSRAYHALGSSSPARFQPLRTARIQQRTQVGMAAIAGGSIGGAGVLHIERVPCLSDNYSWLLHEPRRGVTAVVDPAEAAPVAAALQRHGWQLTHILNTHHHWDHVGGNAELQKQYGCTVVGPAADRDRIPGIQVELADGDRYQLGDAELVCFDTPGHTRGHITLYFPAAKALFPGDTLFSLGCGRLFEGSPAQMWASLSKLTPLPGDTMVYCAHEYTASNARFAAHVDGGNADLQRMKEGIEAKRARGEPTVPSLLADELKCNPFLRPGSAAIREALGVPAGASDAEAFGAIRSAKDSFR